MPAEIRNEIYRLAFVRTPQSYRNGLTEFIFSLAPPALTLVNKQIFAEALSIYYAENNFYLLLSAKDDGLSDQDPFLFHRFTRMIEYFGRQTTSPTDESPMRYIKNIVVQIKTCTCSSPRYYSNVYGRVVDDEDPGTATNQAYSSLCIRGERQRMTFESNSATEEAPFDPTKYRCTVNGGDRLCPEKEAYHLAQMSFTGGKQPIEQAIGNRYHAGLLLEDCWPLACLDALEGTISLSEAAAIRRRQWVDDSIKRPVALM